MKPILKVLAILGCIYASGQYYINYLYSLNKINIVMSVIYLSISIYLLLNVKEKAVQKKSPIKRKKAKIIPYYKKDYINSVWEELEGK